MMLSGIFQYRLNTTVVIVPLKTGVARSGEPTTTRMASAVRPFSRTMRLYEGMFTSRCCGPRFVREPSPTLEIERYQSECADQRGGAFLAKSLEFALQGGVLGMAGRIESSHVRTSPVEDRTSVETRSGGWRWAFQRGSRRPGSRRPIATSRPRSRSDVVISTSSCAIRMRDHAITQEVPSPDPGADSRLRLRDSRPVEGHARPPTGSRRAPDEPWRDPGSSIGDVLRPACRLPVHRSTRAGSSSVEAG